MILTLLCDEGRHLMKLSIAILLRSQQPVHILNRTIIITSKLDLILADQHPVLHCSVRGRDFIHSLCHCWDGREGKDNIIVKLKLLCYYFIQCFHFK